MSPHRALNLALALLMAGALSTAYLLDGPSELEAMQAVAEEVQAATEYAATDASSIRARGQFDQNNTVAQATP